MYNQVQSIYMYIALAITTPAPLSGPSCIMENVNTQDTENKCKYTGYMYRLPALYILTGAVPVHLTSLVSLVTTL